LVGEELIELGLNDLVHVPALTWHQFRAVGAEPLGFLCMVNAERDRPQLPNEDDLLTLRADRTVAEFIQT
jgi:mannose-6-phosphate isomerase-like protein (cupin superfamily)